MLFFHMSMQVTWAEITPAAFFTGVYSLVAFVVLLVLHFQPAGSKLSLTLWTV
jgi:hypothetical protein